MKTGRKGGPTARKNKDTRVEKIFQELQEEGLIDKKRWLKIVKRGNLQGCKFGNCIKYNSSFTANLSEDSIIFALLHEEGHKRVKQFSYVIIGFFGALLIISGGLLGYSKYILTFVGFSIFVLLLFLLLAFINIFKIRLEKDEYRADEYAASVLYEHFEKSPSEIFKKLMKESDVSNDKDPSYWVYLAYVIIEYHPDLIERWHRMKMLEELWGGARNA